MTPSTFLALVLVSLVPLSCEAVDAGRSAHTLTFADELEPELLAAWLAAADTLAAT
jgi:hypothetical protein